MTTQTILLHFYIDPFATVKNRAGAKQSIQAAKEHLLACLLSLEVKFFQWVIIFQFTGSRCSVSDIQNLNLSLQHHLLTSSKSISGKSICAKKSSTVGITSILQQRHAGEDVGAVAIWGVPVITILFPSILSQLKNKTNVPDKRESKLPSLLL